MDDSDLYWLAGLLEGEGSFVHGPPSSPTVPVLRVEMTDLDIVERVASCFERTLQRHRARDERHKQSYSTSIKGASAAQFMRLLRPALSARRQKQIDTALTGVPERSVRWLRSTDPCAVPGCSRISRTRSLCKEHYNSWWKARKYGRRSPITPQAPPPLVASLEVPGPGNPGALPWLAGLLEGEGTFSDSGGYPVIKVSMCDRDVITRAAELFGGRSVWDVTDARAQERGWSPAWATGIAGARGAVLMRQLRDRMGSRRRSEIDRALAAYHPIRLTPAPETCVIEGCERRHGARGLCNAHYMKWSRDRANGREARVRPLR